MSIWENKEYTIKVAEDSFRNYERVMLSSGDCSLFIPMSFIGEEDGETACYECSGFAPLSSYRIEKTDDALYILECVLIIIGKAIEYFIMPARITLNNETVFYNKETSQIKIAYIPMNNSPISLKENLSMFIDELKQDIKDDNGEYLDLAKKFIEQNNYFVREMVNKVGLFKRKIYEESMPKAT